MKPISQSNLDSMEALIPACCDALSAFLAYEGSNNAYEKKAKAASSHVSSYAKLRQSETGRMQVELIAGRVRQREIESGSGQKLLKKA